MIGKIPNETELIHAETVVVDGDIKSICEIEKIDGYYNLSVSTLSSEQGGGFAGVCVENCIVWWLSQEIDEDLNWWVKHTNTPSVRLAKRYGFSCIESNESWDHYIFTGIPKRYNITSPLVFLPLALIPIACISSYLIKRRNRRI